MKVVPFSLLVLLALSGCGGGDVKPSPPCLGEQIAAGYSGTIVGKADGTFWSWGFGTRDEFVSPDYRLPKERLPPKMTWLPPETIEVSLRTNMPCALSSTRELRCGEGLFGTAVADVAQVARGLTTETGPFFTAGINCAVKGNGTVSCFGSTNGEIVEQTAIGNDVVWMALGDRQFCAIKLDASLWCWGAGFLGDGQDWYPENLPQPPRVVSLPLPAVSVAASAGYACAVLADHAVWCWGNRGFGSSTRLDLPPYLSPVRVDITDVQTLVMGAFHTCALKVDGSVWCWGQNLYGQAGYGPGGYVDSRLWDTPRQVVDLGNDVSLIAAGDSHTCARKTDATIWCWGNSAWGQIGNDLIVNPAPVQIRGCQ